MPKLSIITVNLNNATGLQKTIDSVLNQTFTDYEYIVIDGGSTDESKEIIEQNTNKIAYWVSESDKGIYNGMNKGIKQAKGEYCFFLNSGDWLLGKNILLSVFNKNINEDILYFSCKTENTIIEYPKKLTFSFFFDSTIIHQASIIKKTVLEKHNYYNENLSFVADWELFCKAYFDNSSFRKINVLLSFYDTTGYSSLNFKPLVKQKHDAIKQMIPHFYEDYVNLSFYKFSKFVQFVKKIQQSRFYKLIRPPKYLQND